MAEMAVSLAIEQLLPLLRKEANLLTGIHKEFAYIKDELESIQAFLKDAEKRAAVEGDNIREGVKIWVKQVIGVAFRIEDIIDECMIYVPRKPCHPKCPESLHKIVQLIKTLIPRHRIGSEIRQIKSSVCKIKERSERYDFQIQPQESSGIQNAKWYDPRLVTLHMEEIDVVGFQESREKLIGWLVKGRVERTVVSVVGMGGQGKTTLAKNVFDSKEVSGHFACRVWITVSESYTIEGLLRDMLRKFSQSRDITTEMDRKSLIDEVRNYLQQTRYVIVFDDVWNMHFWNEIESAVIDNKNGSKIFITTRNINVALSCKKSSFVKVHELQPLTEEQSLELFTKKAFQFDKCCPKELIDISYDIVKKCKGLPLAIVAIGGLLSLRDKNAIEWKRFCENLSSELNKDSHLTGIKEILSLSYDDLPYHLRSCLLYFGLYPEDYEIESKILLRQWIAEGFVKEEKGKTLEEVAETYLSELINRSLVQTSLINIDGKVKSCRVHDLLRGMIFEKFEDLSFCCHISEDSQSSLSKQFRRLSIETNSNDLMASIEGSHVRSLLVFTDKEITEDFVNKITTKFKLLKVLDFKDTSLSFVPRNIGNLIHLKYLSFRNTDVKSLPKSIGMLQNLETLDVRGTDIHEMPKEISKLRKLLHLRGYTMSFIKLKDAIGEMTSLQSLRYVLLDAEEVVELFQELKKLKQLRELGLVRLRREHGSVLSSLVNEMQHLEKLHIREKPTNTNEVNIDLHLISCPPMLRDLRLYGKLEKLPEWIPKLQNLVELKLECSQLTDDPMESLKHMQNLLSLFIGHHGYEGQSLYFQNGGFHKLKELNIGNSSSLCSIIIDKGSLCSLRKLELWRNTKLKTVPTGIQHLEKLKNLNIWDMPTEFVQSIAPNGGKEHWIIEHVPFVEFYPPGGKSVRYLKTKN